MLISLFTYSSGASLSESFYSLTRYNIRSSRFGRRDFFLSFLVLVIIPYLIRKLDQRMVKLKVSMIKCELKKLIKLNN